MPQSLLATRDAAFVGDVQDYLSKPFEFDVDPNPTTTAWSRAPLVLDAWRLTVAQECDPVFVAVGAVRKERVTRRLLGTLADANVAFALVVRRMVDQASGR